MKGKTRLKTVSHLSAKPVKLSMKHKLIIFAFTFLSSFAIGQRRLDSITIDSLTHLHKSLNLELLKSSEANHHLEQTISQLHETASINSSSKITLAF